MGTCPCCGCAPCQPQRTRDRVATEALRHVMLAMFDRTSDAAWLDSIPGLLEAYLPAGWQELGTEELATHLQECGVTSEFCTYVVGDQCVMAEPDPDCLIEPGHTYTVVAIYDGHMDVECPQLDTTVAGVRIDDPTLTRAGLRLHK